MQASETLTVQDVLDKSSPSEMETIAIVVGAAIEEVNLSENPSTIAQYEALSENQKMAVDFMVGAIISSDLEHASTTSEFLAHYGVKGMRWGFRKSRDSGKASKSPTQLKSSGHRAINALTGDKTFWKRMAVTAGVTAATGLAVVSSPSYLPVSVLAPIFAGRPATSEELTQGISPMGTLVVMTLGGLTVGSGGVAVAGAHVVTNIARAVGGEEKFTDNVKVMSKALHRQTVRGQKRVRQVVSKRSMKHSAVDSKSFIKQYESVSLSRL